jgi:hypothetical protein
LIYCFDTSAINRLLDDPEREPIIKATLNVGSFRMTAYNVIEAAKTTDANRRSRLIELMRRLANGKRPLDRPNTILLTYAEAHAAHADAARVNADQNLEGLWIALNEPDLLDQEAKEEVLSWTKKLEDDFSEIVAGDRDQFQSLFRKVPHERPKAIAATLRAYLSEKDECCSLIRDVYKRQTQKQLTDSEYGVLVREPVWPLYFLGYAYAAHHRGIKGQHFAKKHNAGAIDLGQAVYLTLCDRFVTDDRAQYRGLRLLNVLNNKRRTQVLQYDTFRSRLFGVHLD